jgi:hypothetical protein
MSALLDLYRELKALNERALRVLESGADLAALEPLFEQKAALSAQLSRVDLTNLSEDRAALLAAQQDAALSESNLVKALHPFVSSNENKSFLRPQKAPERPGKGFDFLG